MSRLISDDYFLNRWMGQHSAIAVRHAAVQTYFPSIYRRDSEVGNRRDSDEGSIFSVLSDKCGKCDGAILTPVLEKLPDAPSGYWKVAYYEEVTDNNGEEVGVILLKSDGPKFYCDTLNNRKASLKRSASFSDFFDSGISQGNAEGDRSSSWLEKSDSQATVILSTAGKERSSSARSSKVKENLRTPRIDLTVRHTSREREIHSSPRVRQTSNERENHSSPTIEVETRMVGNIDLNTYFHQTDSARTSNEAPCKGVGGCPLLIPSDSEKSLSLNEDSRREDETGTKSARSEWETLEQIKNNISHVFEMIARKSDRNETTRKFQKKASSVSREGRDSCARASAIHREMAQNLTRRITERGATVATEPSVQTARTYRELRKLRQASLNKIVGDIQHLDDLTTLIEKYRLRKNLGE